MKRCLTFQDLSGVAMGLLLVLVWGVVQAEETTKGIGEVRKQAATEEGSSPLEALQALQVQPEQPEQPEQPALPELPDPDFVFQGRVEEAGTKQPVDGTWYRMHEFTANEGDALVIDLRSDEFDSFLYVHSPSGRIMMDDDSGGGLNARLMLQADSGGTFLAFANTVAAGETGEYKLSVSIEEFVPVLSVSGVLGEESALDRDSETFFEKHSIEVETGQILFITMRSEEFDALLRVMSPGGQEMADDDSGGGTNGTDAQLTITAEESGSLEIFAYALEPETGGAYSLDVRRIK